MFIIAEIGINHNGDLKIAKELIDAANLAGCDAVKFQKRTVEKLYSKEFLDSPRESPWGTTQREQKEGLEFGKEEYDIIDAYCKEKGIEWFFSAWDVDSQIFGRQYNVKYNKVASPMLGNREYLETVAQEKKYTFISTGMSTLEELDEIVTLFREADCPFELMHCNSSYPTAVEDANLLVMDTLKERYNCKVGISSHETGIISTLGAVARGATSVERHITLDKTMYGSDQHSSLEPQEFIELNKNIRALLLALGDGQKVITESEAPIRKKLRG